MGNRRARDAGPPASEDYGLASRRPAPFSAARRRRPLLFEHLEDRLAAAPRPRRMARVRKRRLRPRARPSGPRDAALDGRLLGMRESDRRSRVEPACAPPARPNLLVVEREPRHAKQARRVVAERAGLLSPPGDLRNSARALDLSCARKFGPSLRLRTGVLANSGTPGGRGGRKRRAKSREATGSAP